MQLVIFVNFISYLMPWNAMANTMETSSFNITKGLQKIKLIEQTFQSIHQSKEREAVDQKG